jgi:predicted dehydrogenase
VPIDPSGAIGRLLSANVISTTMAFVSAVEKAMIFAENAADGATLVTIQGGPTLDLAIALLGQAEDMSALASTQFKQVTLGNSKELQQRTPDHLLVQARRGSALPLSVEVAAGRPKGQTPFSFHVVGEKGELLLEGGAPRGFQSGELQLRLNEKVQQVDEGELDGLTESALNVAGMYAAFRDDILSGSHTVPNFDHAVRLTRLIDDVLSSSELGRRKVANDWPKQHEVNATEAGVRPSR